MTALTVYVPGKAAPKGSLRSVGRGRMIEDVKGSKPWRMRVVIAAAQARDYINWKPLTGPVGVDIWVITPRPKTVKREYPTTRSSGDSDKLARNILDAIVDARLIGDDSQVIDLNIHKRYPDAGEPPGTTITVRAVDEPAEAPERTI